MRPENAGEKAVAAGMNAAANSVGLSGLGPFEVIALPEIVLRAVPGVLRLWLDLPAGVTLDPERPASYRVFGGEAGLEFERNGRVVTLGDVPMPLELPYEPRLFPAPPPRGQLALDLSFRYRNGPVQGYRDVQWRQPVLWHPRRGATVLELCYALQA